MSSKIAHIDFHQTPTDFGAQIYESNQIKALLPLYNRRLRKVKKMFQYRTDTDELGYLRLSIEAIDTDNPAADEKFGLFRSPRQASKKMHQLADQYFLCHKLLGLESSHGRNTPCFRAQLKKCFGACCGKETADTYNERMQVALKDYQIKIWPYTGAILIEEHDPQNSDLHCYHLVNNWRYLAKLSVVDDIYDYGFTFQTNANELQEQAQVEQTTVDMESRFDLDIYFILVRFLANTDRSVMSHLQIHPLTTSNQIQNRQTDL